MIVQNKICKSEMFLHLMRETEESVILIIISKYFKIWQNDDWIFHDKQSIENNDKYHLTRQLSINISRQEIFLMIHCCLISSSLINIQCQREVRLRPYVTGACHATMSVVVFSWSLTVRPSRATTSEFTVKFFFADFIPPTSSLNYKR